MGNGTGRATKPRNRSVHYNPTSYVRFRMSFAKATGRYCAHGRGAAHTCIAQDSYRRHAAHESEGIYSAMAPMVEKNHGLSHSHTGFHSSQGNLAHSGRSSMGERYGSSNRRHSDRKYFTNPTPSFGQPTIFQNLEQLRCFSQQTHLSIRPMP